jgi:hypothetical protein
MSKTPNYLIFTGLFILLNILFLLSSCKHDPEVFSDICFESEILPIFQNNCTKSGCHNPDDATSDVVLNNYENIMAAGVTAGNAKKSLIYKALTRGVEPMPPDGKLTGNQIALIYSWIQGGAQNTIGCGVIDSIPLATCDTTNIKYSTVIAPIFNACCNSLSCHGGTEAINFTTYGGLSSFLNGDAQALLDNINYVGEQNMPPSTKLDSCTIKKITIWIQAGYPNN